MSRSDASPSAPFPVAIVGMALRVPGASTIERYWSNLVAGRDCLTRMDPGAMRAAGVPQADLAHPDFVRALPELEDVEDFDADFFGLSSLEATLTDPAHRLFLECAFEALEAAGIVPGRRGPVTGVFGGCEGNYRQRVLGAIDDPQREPALALPIRIGNSIDFLPARVSHRLDLTGPSVGVMAACATSLVAIDLAIQSLARGDCDVALAGGATVMLGHHGYAAGIEGMLSPTGRLRPFDAAADGTIFGSGAGVVALRPLDDALAAGNPIRAVLLGTASNNDGRPPGKESFVAPGLEGQVEAIERAMARARVSAATIGYVEAHGTGTRLGDPVEVAALCEVYRRHTSRTGYCSLGSVKANVGHLRTAAGVASVVKACLALERRTRPPLAGYERPNPRVDIDASPFVLHADARDWPAGDGPRRAAVSSFGFGGANAHAVLEEAPPPAARAPAARRVHLLPLSARTPAALARTREALAVHAELERPEARDVARTLAQGRVRGPHRACFLAGGERVDATDFARGAALASGIAPDGTASLVFLFAGQGAQRAGAGRALYESDPAFRAAIDDCARGFAPALDLLALLGYRGDPRAPGVDDALRRTDGAQPALFAIGYAGARMALARGFAPAALLGHSIGELVAACVAGVFALDDALALVALRGRLMQACPPGAMAAVFVPEALVAESLPADLEIAAVNGPAITVLAGPAEAIERYRAAAAAQGVATQRLDTSHAFHSRAMAPALDAFADAVARVRLAPPARPVISNVTGAPLTAAEATDPRYWAAHIRRPVRFSAGLAPLLALPDPVFVEMGPGAALADLVRRHDPDARAFALLPGVRGGGDEARDAEVALAAAWCAGAEVARDDDEGARLVTLPPTPLERRRHRYDDPAAAPSPPGRVLHERAFADAPLPPPAAIDTARTWFVVGDPAGIAGPLRDRLIAAGADAVLAAPGPAFGAAADGRATLRPAAREDWHALFATRPGGQPRVVLATALAGRAGPALDADAFAAAAARGLDAVAALAQGAFDLTGDPRVDVLVLADHLVRLDGEAGDLCPAQAALAAAMRAVTREMPGLRLRAVDLPPDPSPAERDTFAARLVDEAQAASEAALVALRTGRRLEERLYELPEPARGPVRLREGGAVLVTGGTGGLGLKFAEALFDRARARLVLTARWSPPPEDEWPRLARAGGRVARALAAVLALRAKGADVTIVRADASRREDLAAAIDAVRARHGAIHGVVHAAGVSSRELVVQRTAANAAGVLGPKALAALHLDALLAGTPLDIYLPVASLSSQAPAPGQFDYAAANAVLDALARNRAARGDGLACAIGWGPWQGAGIAVDRLNETIAADRARAPAPAADDGLAEVAPLRHPVLHERARFADGRWRYRGTLRPGQWVVDDHRLDGRSILSGTTTVQLAVNAFADHAPGPGVVELTDVAFLRPVFTADAGSEIELAFERAGADERFELSTRPAGAGGAWQLNASGYARRRVVPPRAAPPVPPPAWWDEAPRARDFGVDRLAGGPRWAWRRWERARDGVVWSRVTLPAGLEPDLDEWDLHPALLDAATQGARGLKGEVVPHTYDAIRVHAPLTADFFAAATLRYAGGAPVNDVVVVDRDGRTLVELEGLVLRLIAGSALDGGAAASPAASASRAPRARRAVVAEPGNLDSLVVEPFEPPAPGPGEVLIEVRAAGLNFRDVLTALGQMPLPGGGRYAPGGEASGVVVALGEGVRRLAVGDPVVAIARGSLATHAIAPAHATAAMPANLDFERAAGLPIVFLTACHALEEVARLARGESVLVHAGAGGVGLAAIQVARALGARVFATAGSEEKRAYLRSLGVEAVFDSRSLDFVDGVRAATGGEGVDVVLNSLAGEFIAAGLAALAPHGRFVEIGKRDLLADAKLGLAPFLRNLSFAAFDLGQMVDRRHPSLPASLDALMDRFARGELKPPPTAIVRLDDAAEGFRRMARAKHVGKIVFAVDHEDAARGELARAFEEAYGEGVPVDWGLAVFRRVLEASDVPPSPIAAGMALGAEAAEARARPAAESERGRDRLSTAYRAPGDEVEQALVDLWERTLGFAPIGVDDDFVDLGGDSIEAIQVQHAIQRDFGLRLRNTEFLAEPTIAALARRISAARAGGAPAAARGVETGAA